VFLIFNLPKKRFFKKTIAFLNPEDHSALNEYSFEFFDPIFGKKNAKSVNFPHNFYFLGVFDF
jgi:hypothetical protein